MNTSMTKTPPRSNNINSTPTARRQCRPRRGVALLWVALVMMVLIGFVALGIDIGRMHLARTQLQTGADGAARAAVWPVPELRFGDGVQRAEDVIADNTAGGGPIGFAPQDGDLQYGIWWRGSRTFQPLHGEELVQANAVRIVTHRASGRGNPLPMTFARLLGFNEVDISVSAIAMMRGSGGAAGSGAGIYGMEWVRLDGITRTDSYDATEGPYDALSARSNGGITTNGFIELGGTTMIDGDARWGPDGDTSPDTDYLSAGPNTTITGWQAPVDEKVYFPPAELPAIYNNQPLIDAGILNQHGDIRVQGNTNITIPGGTRENPNVYVVRDIIVRSNTTVQVDGAVEIYATGNVDITGNVLVNDADGVSNPLPANFKLFVVGSGSVDLGGGSALYAQVYAPESAVKIHGTGSGAGLFGGVVGRTVWITGNSAIHTDESLQWPGVSGSAFWVEMVR